MLLDEKTRIEEQTLKDTAKVLRKKLSLEFDDFYSCKIVTYNSNWCSIYGVVCCLPKHDQKCYITFGPYHIYVINHKICD